MMVIISHWLKHGYILANLHGLTNAVYNAAKDMVYFMDKCASGGGITTARELMVFLKAFWSGKLFDAAIFEKLALFNRLQLSFYPICYAGGYMRIDVGYPFMSKKELLGHSGSTGSFAFYSPAQDLFFVGDVNQAANPALPIRLVMKLAWLHNNGNL